MKNKIIGIFAIIVIIVSLTVGCIGDMGGTTTEEENEVKVDSEIVELAFSSIDFIKDNDEIVRVEVSYRFKNIAGKDIDFKVYAEFYDIDNNLIFDSSDSPKEFSLPDGYTEIGIGPANKIGYSGTNLKKVDHVVIKAIEIEN